MNKNSLRVYKYISEQRSSNKKLDNYQKDTRYKKNELYECLPRILVENSEVSFTYDNDEVQLDINDKNDGLFNNVVNLLNKLYEINENIYEVIDRAVEGDLSPIEFRNKYEVLNKLYIDNTTKINDLITKGTKNTKLKNKCNKLFKTVTDECDFFNYQKIKKALNIVRRGTL